MRSSIRRIVKERTKQQAKYNFTPTHDDKYIEGELKQAANCILSVGTPHPVEWPWSDEWYERIMAHPRTQQLVIAASLLVAEIERRDRHEFKEENPHVSPERQED